MSRASALSIVLACLATVFSGVVTGSETPGDAIIKHVSDDQKSLLGLLSDRNLWKDAGPRTPDSRPKPREAELLRYLKAASAMRSPAIVSILAPKIAFSPYENVDSTRIIPMKMKYPVYAVLKSIGIPAIPALLERLKTIDPENRKPRPDLPGTEAMEYRLAWQCIADIYSEKEFFVRGIPMAEMRIGFEIEDIRKKTGRRNTVAEKRLQRVIKDMQKTEEFLKKR